MSTMTPPPHDEPIPPAPPERRCPRCGHALAPDQDWCLACGAAADTEVAEPRGWRVPIMLSGALGLLALLGIVLLIVALAGNNNDEVAQPTPTPSAAVPPAATPTPTVSPLPTLTPSPTTGPGATATPIPGSTVTPSPSPVSSFPGWTGGDGWTIIIESATTQAKAESAAQAAHANGETVGILKSDDYASLNAGYWVVFTGQYTTKQEAEGNLESVRAQHQDAYVRQIKS